MGYNPECPRPKKKYILIPEEDWYSFKDYTVFDESYREELKKDYKRILIQNYSLTEWPF